MEKINTSTGTLNPFQNAVGLSAVWQKCMSELFKSNLKALVGREHGELGKVRKSVGMKQATELVDYAIRNWDKFARKSAKDAGKDIFPEKPSVGWFSKYHATALLMQQEELQSIAIKKAEEEAKKNKAEETAKALEELKKVKPPEITLLQLTPEQVNACINLLDDPANEAWFDKVTEKYGEWRPAKPNQKGSIPCDIPLKKAA
jgi:hypothetical protein